MSRVFPALAALIALSQPALARVPDNCRQLIVATSDSWNANTGELQLFERASAHDAWQPVSDPTRVLFGKNGLAWGRGVAGQDEPGRRKTEGDNRAPAGIFSLGRVFTYETALPPGANYPFHTVTAADGWIEDPAHPEYNRHVRVADPTNPPPWFKRAQMKQNDFAHHWKIEIHHNANPVVPGDGSAIFFHIQRGPNRHSAGCTTMPQPELLKLISWLRPNAHPHYVLLPKADYASRQSAWHLP